MTAALIRPVPPFAAATLAPVPLLALAAAFGGGWALLALGYMTLLRFSLDALIATAGPAAAPGSEFPAAGRLSQGLAIVHFPLLGLGVAAVSGATGLGFWDGLATFLAFGMYLGQVSTSNAHELIHRTDRFQFALGKWVLISLLYGHHVTAHLKVHHRFVATPDDPSTARLGQGFWDFLGQAWAGAFRAGWEIERSAARIAGRALPWWRHPYAEYLAGGAAFALASVLAFGLSGLVAFLLLAAYAQFQLILSDYVQHYGLRRRRVGDDEWEPVAPWHSWNAAHWFSGGLMLNAPRHSEHHTHPAVPYPELGLPGHMEGPRLPKSLPTMGAIALVPALWRRMMDRRAAAWQARIDEGSVRRNPRLPVRTDAAPVAPRPGSAPGPRQSEALAGALAEAARGASGTRRKGRATPGGPSTSAATGPAADDPPAGDPFGPAAAARFVRSSALFAPDGPDDHATSAARQPAAGGGIRQPAAEASEDVDAAIAELVQSARAEARRRSARFSAIAPDEADRDATGGERARAVAQAGRLAAKALAALMRGAPPGGARPDT